MAAVVLPAPGAKYGPCAGPCKHQDCAETRATAGTRCSLCNKQIGYDEPYFQQVNGPQHAVCVHDALVPCGGDLATTLDALPKGAQIVAAGVTYQKLREGVWAPCGANGRPRRNLPLAAQLDLIPEVEL